MAMQVLAGCLTGGITVYVSLFAIKSGEIPDRVMAGVFAAFTLLFFNL